MPTLTFLGGPPGVGKTSVAKRLLDLLPSCAWLDADDVWRFRPIVVAAETMAVAEQNIAAVVRGHLQLPVDHVVVTWVFHRDDIVERIATAIRRSPDHRVALVCGEAELRRRLAARGGTTDPAHALLRLQQVRRTRAVLCDTVGVGIDDVALRLASLLTPAGGRVARLE